MNKVLLTGRLVKDAEIKEVGEAGKNKLNFTLAVQRDYLNSNDEREADFISVVAWNKLAENLHKYLTKGRMINVIGKINVSSYVTQDGVKKYVTQIVAEEVEFLDSKNKAV